MKKSELIALGISDELADQVIIAHGKDIEKLKAGNATAQAEADAFKAQLTEANATIEGFKKLDVDGIKAAADDWKSKAEQATKDAAAQMAGLKFDHALEGALAGAKVKNAKAVSALLSTDTLKDANGGFIAERLTEQLAKIKSENDYLFEDATPAPRIVAGGNSKSVLSDAMVDAARKGAGLPPAQGQ